MKKLVFGLIFSGIVLSLSAQAGTIGFRFGYNLHNCRAGRFNTLINDFNLRNYPARTTQNLRNVNFMQGFTFGIDYGWNESLSAQIVLKNKHQMMSTRHIESGDDIYFKFRQNTAELGVSALLGDYGWFRQYAGGGLLLGYTSVFTEQNVFKETPRNRHLTNIDHTGVFGISLSYETRFVPHELVQIYLRPVIQFALNAKVRRLDDFFNPEYDASDGSWSYGSGLGDKYNQGNLNGIGVEAGLVFVLKMPQE